MRLDKYLFENGYTESRMKAQKLIESGCVAVDQKTVLKASFDLSKGAEIKIIGNPLPYVSRGGLKLKGAQDLFGLHFEHKIACDIGASTGGFTDVLLKGGADLVFAVDCGTGQLHSSLQNHPKVRNLEGINARYLSYETIGCFCDLVVTDVSFISQSYIYESVVKILKPGGEFISLIKPQFEAGRAFVGKGGLVRDTKVRKNVILNLIEKAEKSELYCKSVARSPIDGGDGNAEYLAYFIYKNPQNFNLSLVNEIL
jgi:23S rRNA (cytidine1920-2'-O)/16S rRNA (cytidine1409-2'-O)-methyltransferase